MYHRFGHAKEHFVKFGDKVKKGQKILSVGTGNGQWSAHCHYDCPIEKLVPWTSYVFGMSEERVCATYANPKKNIKTVMPEYDHMGFDYLEHANYGTAKVPKWCFHPGVDLNGAGAGNADLGDPIYSPCDGVVVFDFDDGKALDGGWGRLLVIKEVVEKPAPVVAPTPAPVSAPAPMPAAQAPVATPVPQIETPTQPAPISKPAETLEIGKEYSGSTITQKTSYQVVSMGLKFILSKIWEFILKKIKI